MELQTVSSALDDLSSQLTGIVRDRTHGAIHDLGVEVSDKSVTISGRANTYYAKQLATTAIQEIEKHRALNNEIVVH